MPPSVQLGDSRRFGGSAGGTQRRGGLVRISGRRVRSDWSGIATRDVYNLLAEHLWRVAGIQLHTGKTRSWNKSGISPPNVEDLGEQVWSREGIKVLGTSVGTDQFVSDVVTERVQEESRLWEAIGVGTRFAGCLADSPPMRGPAATTC